MNCLVVGGGFAGLSSAVFLAEKGYHIQLIEASPKLGGRAYSFEHNGDIVDNGQHILMGCYLFTLEFFELINSLDTVEIQPYLNINFVARGGGKHRLSTEGVTYPFNILSALRSYTALSNSEKYEVVKLFLKIAVCNPKHYSNVTTKDFLVKQKQSQTSIDALWDILHVGTMNCGLEESSAEIFIRVLKQIFFTVDDATKIILPKVGLSETYCKQSVEFLERKNGSVALSEKLISVDVDPNDNKIKAVTTSKATLTNIDFLILAIPPYHAEKVFTKSNLKISLPDYEYSSILNVHLWLENNPFNEKFYGLINSKIHWLFNHGNHITLVTSAADDLIVLPDEEIIKIFSRELKDYFNVFNAQNIKKYLVIKEKRATFKPSVENTLARKKLSNNFGNIFFAGDWTNTDYPATIEGAVKSAIRTVDKISELN